jgi:hypothetical protein
MALNLSLVNDLRGFFWVRSKADVNKLHYLTYACIVSFVSIVFSNKFLKFEKDKFFYVI